MIPAKNKENNNLGWIYRRFQAIPKYMFSKGFSKSQTLFGINQIIDTDRLFIVKCSFINSLSSSGIIV